MSKKKKDGRSRKRGPRGKYKMKEYLWVGRDLDPERGSAYALLYGSAVPVEVKIGDKRYYWTGGRSGSTQFVQHACASFFELLFPNCKLEPGAHPRKVSLDMDFL